VIAIVGRSCRPRKSRNFGLPGAEGQVRVANHARTPKQRLKHPEVVASLVLRRERKNASAS
jgi:hypothetical protein